MYKLLVVDDEPLIVNGLISIIKNGQSDFTEIIGANDGFEALELAEEFQPDMVLTDINMPEMNGIKLIESMINRELCSQFAILTGYEDFDYARQALKFRVNDYLTKPIDKNELFAMLKHVAENLERGRTERRETVMLKLRDVIFFGASCEEVFISPSELTYLFDGKSVLLFLIQYEGHVAEVIAKQLLTVREVLSRKGAYVHLYMMRYLRQAVLLIDSMDSEQIAAQDMSSFGSWFELAGVSVQAGTISFGAAGRSGPNRFLELPDLYMEARASLYCQRAVGTTDLSACFLQKNNISIYHKIEQWMAEGRNKKEEQLVQDAKAFIDDFQLSAEEEALFRELFFGYLDIYLQHAGHSLDDVFPNAAAAAANKPLAEALASSVRTVMSGFHKEESRMEEPGEYSPTMKRILQYVEGHFQEDISLDQISDSLQLHPNYISSLFKQETGVTFLQYLHAYRIEQTKIWMVQYPDWSIQNLAIQAGYENQRHFFKVFKKMTRMTPGQYREKVLAAAQKV